MSLNVVTPISHRTVDAALLDAVEDKHNLKEILILGVTTGDQLFSVSSKMSQRDGLWLIERFKQWMMSNFPSDFPIGGNDDAA